MKVLFGGFVLGFLTCWLAFWMIAIWPFLRATLAEALQKIRGA